LPPLSGVAASSLFAEHAAPGLIELFAERAADLDVEVSVQPGSACPLSARRCPTSNRFC
jgi:hypothetical protein